MRPWPLLLVLLCSCHPGPLSLGTPDGAALPDATVADARAAVDATAPQGDLAPLCGAPQCQPGMLCQAAQGCCSCGPFARACLSGWTCAQPAGNDPRCPAAPPASLTACSLPDGIACWYCAAGAPRLADCASAMGRSECQAAGLTRCWEVTGPTMTCD